MATGLLLLLDDITAMLDDVAVMSKVAVKKTSGIIGDDLALNAQQMLGSPANREIPVIARVAFGSLINKVILIPSALVISAFAPGWVIPALLTAGGVYLCFEGVEKILHNIQHKHDHDDDTLKETVEHAVEHVQQPHGDPTEEKKKIRGAIRTDLILSAEIIVITLGAVAESTLMTQFMVLSTIGLGMTVGVYGLVAGIVKIDDLGLYLMTKSAKAVKKIGAGLIAAAPVLMKILSIVGTAAMFVVGGELLIHNIPPIEHVVHDITHSFHGGFVQGLASILAGALTGVIAGCLAVAMFKTIKKAIPGKQESSLRA